MLIVMLVKPVKRSFERQSAGEPFTGSVTSVCWPIRIGVLLKKCSNVIFNPADVACAELISRPKTADNTQTQPVGLGMPPYLVIGFIGPVIHNSKTSFWSSPMCLANLRIGGTEPNCS